MNDNIKYNIYPSLLDAYQDYLNSEAIWLRFWGNSETPKVSLEEFEQRQFKGLIDKINREPMAWQDSEAADRGTVFNEIIDCIILHNNSDKFEIRKEMRIPQGALLKTIYNGREFIFPANICREFARYFVGAQPQVFCERTMDTDFGNVRLYGYIDEVLPHSLHDIKVASSYEAWKFKDKWQRVVYPYCHGVDNIYFEYNILVITPRASGDVYEIKKEFYNVTPHDFNKLRAHLEDFIIFLEENKENIYDNKIFNK